MALEEQVSTWVNEKLRQPDINRQADHFLVEARVLPRQRIRVLVDSDKGVTVDTCAAINRYLRHRLQGEGYDYSIEVSSPGATEPLKLLRQYKKNIGRRVQVDKEGGATEKGTLLFADDEKLVLRKEQQKKRHQKAVWESEIPRKQVIKTRVIIKF